MTEGWQTLLVPVSREPASLEAVRLAAWVAKSRRARVHLVHVIEVVRSQPLNVELEAESRQAQQLLERAGEVAAEAGFPGVKSTVVQSREAGPAVIEEARAQQADVIVLGLPPFEGEDRPFAIGSTAEFLLRHAPCEVWLVRLPMHAAYRGGHRVR
ncbi:universal stress protein [Tepidiforma sp.]|uniref:universal stress protein n=1 Tax=Tepidiforma sp. TaxID=2682230 RepID=UPI002ADE09A5|nr:universal stress protein [Tepidiforma sp.]